MYTGGTKAAKSWRNQIQEQRIKSLHLCTNTMEPHLVRKYQPSPPPPSPMDAKEDDFLIQRPEDWFTKLISFQVDIIYNILVSLTTNIISLLSLVSESYHRAEETKDGVESAVHTATMVPSTITHGSTLLLKKLGIGFIGAAYACMVMLMVLILAAAVGIGLVQLWVEEPVLVRESLHFDYTDVHPKAVFLFGAGGGVEGTNTKMGVPVGHTFSVSLVLLMPESDFNRHIGVFQLTAELLSKDGYVIAKSSQPCMLRFRSLPVRLMRTCLFGIPLLLGVSSETQKLAVQILKHKEGNPRSGAIRVTLIPRAGTSSPPQLYEAEILMNSQLPWRKELVHNWKWTFYVWTTLYMYIFFLMILICCFKPLVFPVTSLGLGDYGERDPIIEVAQEPQARGREDREISESLRKWQRSRSRRRAMFLQGVAPEIVGASASSITLTREDTSAVAEEEVGDSESVHLRG